ncbi:class I SAM-dependent methyltransferase [Cognatitamlana onchidii]|uniref:class I SAM-dependent methyltransferase n=1 Tax=Cognatitamlana onchidii TaxID=2562860 RepID=UPI001F37FE02|nr:class I SAM-dependent methyltransferase [Algibacter onchidii]
MIKTRKLRDLWYGLSSKQRFFVRRLYYWPVDMLDKVMGRTNKYVPPRGSIYTGSPSGAKKYLQQGQNQLQLLKDCITLSPSDKVLDIGSGVGRTAIALSTYINKEGSYDGFDVVKQGVDWCNNGLGMDFPNFKFKYVPIFNDLYNESKLKATEFNFPYEDDRFNKIFSFSLFTHMQKEEIQNYFFEIARVLKKEGLCFSTFFLYNSENEEYIGEKPNFNFPHKEDDFRLMHKDVKSGNIAFHEDGLKTMLSKANLECVKIIDGFWKDKIRDTSKKEYQDIVVFRLK